MVLNNEQQVFLTQEDQEAHILKQFQTQSSESFDFREEYDTAIYEVHKQYSLRSRRIDVPETNKQKDTKQPNKGKISAPPYIFFLKQIPTLIIQLLKMYLIINHIIKNLPLLFLLEEK